MRILVFAPDLNGKSGWSRYSLDIVRALKAAGHEVFAAVSARSEGSPCEEYPILPSPMQCLHGTWRRKLAAWKTERLVSRLEPDIVHFMAEPYALLLPSWKQAPASCMTIHGSYAVIPLASKGSTLLRSFQLRLCWRIGRIISVSNFTKGYLRDMYPEVFEQNNLEQKITVIPNGIDHEQTELSEPGHTHANRLSIVFVGAIKKRKGVLEAVEACRVFWERTKTDFMFDIIGNDQEDTRYAAEVRHKIAHDGLQDHVRLRGVVSERELTHAYAQADLYMMLSLHSGMHVEGFGLVFLEANIHGVPVIGPSTGGCPEAISEGMSGYVCDPADAETVAKRMEDILLKHTIKREDCIAWAQSHTVKQATDRIMSVYEELVRKP